MTNAHDECTIFLLAKASQRAQAVLKQHLKLAGLTPLQFLILTVLDQEDGQAAGEIGARLTLDSATLSGTLDRMRDGEWIEKIADPKDRRVVRIHTTAKAKKIAPSLTKLRIAANDEILADLSLEERLLLKRLLKDIRDAAA